MRLIIAGPRDLEVEDKVFLLALYRHGLDPTMVISGGAPGIDSCADRFARNHGIQPVVMDALWDYHRSLGMAYVAGPIRNENMAAVGEALLVVRDKGRETKGTNSMIDKARKAGIPIHIYEIQE